MPSLIPIVIRIQPNVCPKKCADGGMATLITTVLLIMTGLQTADDEEVRFALIMRAVYGVVVRKLAKQSEHDR